MYELSKCQTEDENTFESDVYGDTKMCMLHSMPL